MKNTILEQIDREYTEIQDLQDTIKYTKKQGSHFFDNSTMLFFNSKVHGNIVKSKDGIIFFITEETNPENITKYTVRLMLPGASFQAAPKFFHYDTFSEAQSALTITTKNNVIKGRNNDCHYCKELEGFYKAGEKTVMCTCMIDLEIN